MRTHTLSLFFFFLQEAAKKVKTVHAGFFANQGPVATVGSPGGGGGDAGGDDASEADSEAGVRPKKKKVQKYP